LDPLKSPFFLTPILTGEQRLKENKSSSEQGKGLHGSLRRQQAKLPDGNLNI